MLIKTNQIQTGLTLIELLVTLVISSVIMIGLASLMLSSAQNSKVTIDSGRLDRALYSAMNVIANDVRRAGYWASANSSSSNPFMASGTDISVNASNNCILLTYDHDANGSLPSVSSAYDDERYGFRLSGDAIQFRPRGAVFSCAAAASNWENLTDPNVIKITAFNVTKMDEDIDLDGAGPGTAKTTLRKITITITGQLANDASVTRTLTRTVKVYNDKYTS